MNDFMRKAKSILQKRKLYCLYTVLFLVLYYYTVWYWEIKDIKILLWAGDGVEAEYIPFVYVGQWIRRIFTNLIHLHTPIIPQWDMSIGYGSDIITTLQGTLFDPFTWISAFFSPRYSERAIRLVILLKRYFTGISFIWLVKNKGIDDRPALAGAVSYAFCTSIMICFKQIYLIDSFYILPLMILAVDKLWNDKKHISFYSFILAFSLLDSYYYTFMIAIFAVMYFVTKLVIQKEKEPGFYIGLFSRFFLGTLLGTITGIGVLLGGIIQLFSTERISGKVQFGVLYADWIHKGMLTNLPGGVIDTGTDVLVGISIVSCVCVVLLYFEKGHTAEKIWFPLLTVGLFIPYVGHVFNGFHYATDRWIFGYALLVSWIVCLTFDRLCRIRIKEILAVMGIFILHYLILKINKIDAPSWYIPVFFFAFITMCILSYISIYESRLSQGSKLLRSAYIIGLTALCISSVIPYYLYLSPEYGNWISLAASRGSLFHETFYRDGKALIYDDPISDASRYEETGDERVYNSSMLLGLNGIDYYLHFYNNYIDRYHKELCASDSPVSFRYHTLDGHNILQYLNGVNSIIYRSDQYYPVYGYGNMYKQGLIENDREYSVYTGDYPRTLAFSCDSAVSYDEYLDLDPYDKETLLSKACIVDDNSANTSLEDITIPDDELKCKIEAADGSSYEDGVLMTEGNGEQLVVSVDRIETSGYLYLYVQGIERQEDRETTIFNVEAGAGNSDRWLNDMYYDMQYILTQNDHMYDGRDSVMLCLGRIDPKDGIDRLYLKCSNPGKYKIDDLRVYLRPDSELDEVIRDYDGKYLNMSITSEGLNIDISKAGDRYIYVAVPYSTGWTATIEGKPVNILRADTAFMAIDTSELAEPGGSILEMRYKSPLFGIGAVVTLVGFLLMIVIYCRLLHKCCQ